MSVRKPYTPYLPITANMLTIIIIKMMMNYTPCSGR